MSSSEASPVAELKSKLTEAERERAAAMGAAEAAANALISDPSPERRVARDEAAANVEVFDLKVEEARRQLRVAEVARHRESIANLGAEHGEAQGEIGDVWATIERATGMLEGSCERGAGLRREAQRRTGRAREHHALAGGDEHERPSFMIALPRTNQIRARLQKVIEQLQRLEIPNW
jgi:hypothetical protein